MPCKKKWKSFILVILPLIVGFITYLLIKTDLAEFTKTRPDFVPSGIVFFIAWTILYTLMGISSMMIYQKDDSQRNTALTFYFIQLVVNMIWPILFFSVGNYLLSFVWLIALICLVIVMMIYFYKVNKLAFVLNIVYGIWLLFALYLNFRFLLI